MRPRSPEQRTRLIPILLALAAGSFALSACESGPSSDVVSLSCDESGSARLSALGNASFMVKDAKGEHKGLISIHQDGDEVQVRYGELDALGADMETARIGKGSEAVVSLARGEWEVDVHPPNASVAGTCNS